MPHADLKFPSPTEIEAEPEDDLNPYCEKRHQHCEFIAINEFSLGHLPEDLRDPTVYVWLRNCAPLVVRLIKSGIKATGRACVMPSEIKNTMTCDDIHCPYRSLYGDVHDTYGGIGIITNKHVIRDNSDSARTRVDFCYNEENDASLWSELGYVVHVTNKKMDYSVFSCYVHSKDIISFVYTLDNFRNYKWQRIPEKIRIHSKQYAIIISHPHGAPKKISIGKVVESEIKDKGTRESENVAFLNEIFNTLEKQGNSGLQRFQAYLNTPLCQDIPISYKITWYSTATCMGSSGAPVYMGNTVIEHGQEINQAHTHRGRDKSKNLNICFT